MNFTAGHVRESAEPVVLQLVQEGGIIEGFGPADQFGGASAAIDNFLSV